MRLVRHRRSGIFRLGYSWFESKWFVIAIVAVFAVVFGLSLRACLDTDNAREALESAGYSDIQVGGIAYCGRDDMGHSFTARDGTRVVSGRVCCNLFGSCYTRF